MKGSVGRIFYFFLIIFFNTYYNNYHRYKGKESFKAIMGGAHDFFGKKKLGLRKEQAFSEILVFKE